MSAEAVVFVRLDPTTHGVGALIRDIRSADTRAKKALPGERTDIIRVESLSSQLERLAFRAWAADPSRCAPAPLSHRFTGPSFIDRVNLHERPPTHREAVAAWIDRGEIAVEIRLPLTAGATPRQSTLGAVLQPESVWRTDDPDASPKKAAAERFKQQVAATLSVQDPPAFIEPSGVSNTILTETLRRFVTRQDGPRVDAPVRYQDGSIAQPFPLRSLQLSDAAAATAFGRELRFAMLSIRHTEMDVEVDGCWLRNYDISRPRPAAETDELAYQLTRSQLTAVTTKGPLLMRLYQTGLDPVVVGFYRALVHHLIDLPGSVGVIPIYFRHAPKSHDHDHDHDPARPKQQSYFAESKRPWLT